MKIIRERINKQGKRQVTVELADGEHLTAFHPERFYETSYPHEQVLAGHHIIDSTPVTWCSFGQEWVS